MSSNSPRFSLNGEGKHSHLSQFDPRKRKIVESLDRRYKELNQLWEEAEADLREIPVPVDVSFSYDSVDADPERPGEYQIRSLLGFVRSKGGWRICFGVERDASPMADYNWKPITECGVNIRLEAVPHIGKLRELVLKAAEECVPTLDKAIAEFRSTMQGW